MAGSRGDDNTVRVVDGGTGAALCVDRRSRDAPVWSPRGDRLVIDTEGLPDHGPAESSGRRPSPGANHTWPSADLPHVGLACDQRVLGARLVPVVARWTTDCISYYDRSVS
jgi:hypothetical protein